MLAFPEISINLLLLATIILGAIGAGFFIGSVRVSKQRSSILKLETEMLQNHAEILHLQKELTEKENLYSTTPIFSIRDSGPDPVEQVKGARLSKKAIGGGTKSTS